jgi:hypothetical protein
MPFLQVEENRYVALDEIVDIRYTPANSQPLPSFPKLTGEPAALYAQHPSSLSIRLKGAEPIKLVSTNADGVWEKYKKAVRSEQSRRATSSKR